MVNKRRILYFFEFSFLQHFFIVLLKTKMMMSNVLGKKKKEKGVMTLLYFT